MCAGNLSRGVGVMGRMNIPSPKEKGPANWLGLLKRFATDKRTLTRVGVIASSFALRELLMPSPPPSFWLVVVKASVLVEMRIEFEACALQALPNGLELFLVLKSHPVEQVVKQRRGLNFIESTEFVEPLFESPPYSDVPTRCQDFYS